MEKNKDTISVDLASVKQCSADEFIANFIDFMNLNDDSNSVGKINFEARYLNKDLLNRIGISDIDTQVHKKK